MRFPLHYCLLILGLLITAPATFAADAEIGVPRSNVTSQSFVGPQPRPLQDVYAPQHIQGRPISRAWKVSLAPLIASQILDVASSQQVREANPLLAGPNGYFGARGTAVKFGLASALITAEYLIVRKFPKTAKVFTILNWGSAAATSAVAAHNYQIR